MFSLLLYIFNLFNIVEQFNDFVKDNSQSHFETDYPKYKK